MSKYQKLMKDQQLKEKVLDIVNNYRTCYLYGGTGQLVTNAIVDQKAKQLPSWYTKSRISALKKLSGKNYYGFDCVNLIKAILWGWKDGKMGKYASNTVPDTNANGFINLCEDVSTDMDNIKPMELIWFSGHVGLYLGNGKCIECAPSLNKVAITNMTYQGKWCKHGKLPWVTYTDQYTVADIQKEINAIDYSLVVDNVAGTKTKAALIDLSKRFDKIQDMRKNLGL